MGWREIRKYHLKKLSRALEKGEVDHDVVPILEAINKNPDYVTRSSCYGRISLAVEEGLIRKGEGKIIFKSHKPIRFEELKRIFDRVVSGVLWMNIESTIIHVAAKDIEAAYRLLKLALEAGYGKSNIYSVSGRGVTVELLIREKYSVPLYIGGVGQIIHDDELSKLIAYISDMFKEIEEVKTRFINLLESYR